MYNIFYLLHYDKIPLLFRLSYTCTQTVFIIDMLSHNESNFIKKHKNKIFDLIFNFASYAHEDGMKLACGNDGSSKLFDNGLLSRQLIKC